MAKINVAFLLLFCVIVKVQSQYFNQYYGQYYNTNPRFSNPWYNYQYGYYNPWYYNPWYYNSYRYNRPRNNNGNNGNNNNNGVFRPRFPTKCFREKQKFIVNDNLSCICSNGIVYCTKLIDLCYQFPAELYLTPTTPAPTQPPSPTNPLPYVPYMPRLPEECEPRVMGCEGSFTQDCNFCTCSELTTTCTTYTCPCYVNGMKVCTSDYPFGNIYSNNNNNRYSRSALTEGEFSKNSTRK